mmetsp:Transcript_14767/g.20540  ORF Transcript_14767/g.20540 Transcript_14767/m.20540 type:complete len:240 (-) Transcript_14767:240-959(-)
MGQRLASCAPNCCKCFTDPLLFMQMESTVSPHPGVDEEDHFGETTDLLDEENFRSALAYSEEHIQVLVDHQMSTLADRLAALDVQMIDQEAEAGGKEEEGKEEEEEDGDDFDDALSIPQSSIIPQPFKPDGFSTNAGALKIPVASDNEDYGEEEEYFDVMEKGRELGMDKCDDKESMNVDSDEAFDAFRSENDAAADAAHSIDSPTILGEQSHSQTIITDFSLQQERYSGVSDYGEGLV